MTSGEISLGTLCLSASDSAWVPGRPWVDPTTVTSEIVQFFSFEYRLGTGVPVFVTTLLGK